MNAPSSRTLFSNRATTQMSDQDTFFPLRKTLRRISGTAEFTTKPAHRKGGRVGMRKVGKK